MLLEVDVIQPYIYQIPCIEKVKQALTERDVALFVMAMGLGKTITSAFIVEDRLRNGQRGLFLCHENYILKRVEKEYRKVIGNDVIYKTFYGSEAQGNKDWTADNAEMLFASFKSLNNWHEKWYSAFDPNHFDFMVVDESHHSQAPSYKEVITYFKCKKIGMTATPDRMDLKDIREIFGEEVFNLPLEEGIANGWLADMEYHVLSDGISNSKLKKICKSVLEDGERVSIKQINETIFISERDKTQKEIIAQYSKIKKYAGDKKTLLFCERTIHADRIIRYFKKGGVMHSKKSWQENNNTFESFENDKLQYVASVNKFNEGKHVPGVEVIVFLRATDSLTIFWQQLGRALAKIGGKKKVIILDFVSNLERLVMVRDMMLRIKKIQDDLLDQPENRILNTNVFDVSGKGFDFIFSDELVDAMKIIEALRKGYYETWQEASEVSKKGNFEGAVDYLKKHRQFDLRLPPYPYKIYLDFPGWCTFLGKESPPEGWKSAYDLKRMGLGGIRTIKTRAKVFSLKLPNSIIFAWKAGDFIEYYSPNLVEIIKVSLFSEKAKINWVPVNKLAKEGLADQGTIIKFVRSLKDRHPDSSVVLEFGHAQTRTLLSPALARLVRYKFSKKPKAKKGWLHVMQLVRQKVAQREIVLVFVEKYRKSNPEYFNSFWVFNRFVEHFSPTLVKIIKLHFANLYKKPPSGWIGVSGISLSIWGNTSSDYSRKILSFLKEFRKKNYWFGIFWSGKKTIEYYHPTLVKKTIEHFAKKKK